MCSVFCPFEYLENTLHAFFFMMKKCSGQHQELEELKKNFKRLEMRFGLEAFGV
ncbi:unnamed protein product [Staurois parvus]|uniref:Uncharacterized protein n=1 Tax=Staurois parvus TaxID=386267 RepID=A0ABN9HAZ4_9NEOB|nr:unnamed protein product [Staurois parvus]